MSGDRVSRNPSRLWRTARTCIVVVALLAALVLVVDPLGLRVPRWVAWQERIVAADLDGDTTPEQVSLIRSVLEVEDSSGAKLYRSPSSWKVQDVIVCDMTHDGVPEIVMLVWRRGNYGSSRPFWDTGIDLRMTEHLYVMGMRDGRIMPTWMGHELGREVVEVVAREDGSLSLVERNGAQTHWEWEGFGFVVE